MRQVGLATPCGANEQNIALGYFNLVCFIFGRLHTFTGTHALVVVIDGNRESFLRCLLADDIFLKESENFTGLRQIKSFNVCFFVGFCHPLFDDLVTQLNALITDIHTGARNELSYLLLALATKGTLQQVSAFAYTCHDSLLVSVVSTFPDI